MATSQQSLRENTRAYCPLCARHVFLVRSPIPPLPEGIVGPEAMYSGFCNCGAGVTFAVTTNHNCGEAMPTPPVTLSGTIPAVDAGEVLQELDTALTCLPSGENLTELLDLVNAQDDEALAKQAQEFRDALRGTAEALEALRSLLHKGVK